MLQSAPGDRKAVQDATEHLRLFLCGEAHLVPRDIQSWRTARHVYEHQAKCICTELLACVHEFQEAAGNSEKLQTPSAGHAGRLQSTKHASMQNNEHRVRSQVRLTRYGSGLEFAVFKKYYATWAVAKQAPSK